MIVYRVYSGTGRGRAYWYLDEGCFHRLLSVGKPPRRASTPLYVVPRVGPELPGTARAFACRGVAVLWVYHAMP